MIYRLYRNNQELACTNADDRIEALWHFIARDSIPAEVVENIVFEDAGPTAVMPEGDVWQVRSLLGNILGLE